MAVSKGFMSFGFSSSNNNEAALGLLRDQLAHFSQYAVTQFAIKDNAIKKVSSAATTLTLRINGIEQTPFVNIDLKPMTTKVNAPYTVPLATPTYEENNLGRLLIANNTVTLVKSGVYMLSYAMFTNTRASFAWYDSSTNTVISGTELSVTDTKMGASATAILHIPEEKAMRLVLRLTSGKQVSVISPSKVAISGINVRS